MDAQKGKTTQQLKKEFLKQKNSEITFEEWLKYEKERNKLIKHNKTKRIACNPVYDPTGCTNGDFNSGTLNQNVWQGEYGVQDGTGAIATGSMSCGIISGIISNNSAHQTIVPDGPDPNIPTLKTTPDNTGFALRIGNSRYGRGVEMISKSFKVTSKNAYLTFDYAVVLDDPTSPHTEDELPTFRVVVTNETDGNQVNNLVDLDGSGNNFVRSNNSDFFNNQGNLVYSDWLCSQIDLSSLIGKNVTVSFVTEDCGKWIHFAYAYIDNICTGCNNAPYSLSFNQGRSSDCGLPANICFDYTIPSGQSLTIQLAAKKNASTLQTWNSPTFTSGSNYCFTINSISGLGNTQIVNFSATGNFSNAPNQSSGISGYKITCGDPDKGNCCPGKNLIKNGDFEGGNANINSEFMFTGTVSQGSVVPGKYSIIKGSEAALISPTWASVHDPSTCSFNTGKFLVVNGQTGGSPLARGGDPVPEKKVIWEQTVNIDHWKHYKFCFKAKNLNQLGFDIKPKIDVKFVNTTVGDILSHDINLSPGSGPCDWVDVSKSFNLWGQGNGTLKIQIVLDQTRHGDGNDIAIDNIALIKLDPCPSGAADFNITTETQAGYFSINATSSASTGCPYPAWTVCEIDPSNLNVMDCMSGTRLYAPNAWAYLQNTNFSGYNGTENISNTSNAGKFEFGKFYKITKGVYGDCKAWTQSSMIVYKIPGANNRVRKFTEKEFKAKKSQIMREFKAKKSQIMQKNKASKLKKRKGR